MAILRTSRTTLSTFMLSLGLIAGFPAFLYSQGSDEAHVKAAFLFNFAKFVTWPSQTFKSPSDSFQICVLGSSTVGSALVEIAHDKTVDGRPLVVTYLSEGNTVQLCQILFVGMASTQKARVLIAEMRSRSVLTVGEAAGFAGSGGIVNFKMEDGRVRFEINPKASEQAHLQISSRLLSLALIVTGTR
jgi:hypothetical protein